MSVATRENVAKLYVAFFGRAADAFGLDYWVNNSGLSLEEISSSFFQQQETQERYPVTLSNESFVATIYTNLFNHEPDRDGLNYWVSELELYEETGGTRGISRDKMILAIVNGAIGNDALILENKTEVGLYFADAGLAYVDFYVSDVTETQQSAAILKDRIDTIVAEDSPEVVFKLNDNITEDDLISHEEVGVDIAVGGYIYTTMGGEKEITLHVNEHTYSALIETDAYSSDFSIDVPGSELAVDSDRTIDAEAVVRESSGETHHAEESERYDVVDGDIIPPNAPVIDGPVSGDDMINSAESEKFSIGGSAESLSTVELIITDSSGYRFIVQTITDTNGKWGISRLDLSGMAEGILRIEATATDLEGNRSIIQNHALLLDTVSPQIPLVKLENDSGSSDSDRVTSDPALSVTPYDPFDTVEYSLDEKQWSVLEPVYGSDGEQTVYVREIDHVGNISGERPFTFTLDRSAPEGVLSFSIDEDSGISDEDGITNDNTLVFSGKTEPKASVTLWIDNERIGTVVADSFGKWMKVYTQERLQDGTYMVSTQVTDVAGNTSAVSSPVPIVIDTKAGLGHIDLDSEDDTGFFSDDNYTHVADMGLKVTLTADTSIGDRMELLLDGSAFAHPVMHTVTQEDMEAGEVLLHIYEGDMATDGEKHFSVTLADDAGNTYETEALDVWLDRSLPAIPEIVLIDDTGVSGNDSISSNGAFEVMLTESDTVAEYSTDGSVWSTERPQFSGDGEYRMYVRQTDLAGNASSAAYFTVTLDTTAPDIPVLDLPVAEDGIVNAQEVKHLVLRGETEAEAMVAVTLLDRNGEKITVHTLADNSGEWQTAQTNFAMLSDGEVEVGIVVTDRAGNSSAEYWSQIILNTEIPPVPQVLLMHDTGGSGSDLVTWDGALNVTVGNAGDTVEYSLNGSLWSSDVPVYTADGYQSIEVREVNSIGSVSDEVTLNFLLDTTAPHVPIVMLENDTGVDGDGYTSDPSLFVIANEEGSVIEYFWNGGPWSSDLPAFNTGDGMQEVWVRECDVAGNVSAAAAFSFYLDQTAPPMPLLRLATDTGSADDDKITQDGRLSPIEPHEPDDVIYYSIDNGMNWQIEMPVFNRDGAYVVWAKEIDMVGNESITASLSFTLDTVPTAAPVIALANDSAAWSKDPVVYTGDGAYTVQVREVDVAGNISEAASLSFTLDTVPTAAPVIALANDSAVPDDRITNDGMIAVTLNEETEATTLTFTLDTTAPAEPLLALDNDTGNADDDRITSDGTLASIEPDETGGVIRYSVDNGGNWQTEVPLFDTDGEYVVWAKETDLAGNESGIASLEFMLDTEAPQMHRTPFIGETATSSMAVNVILDERAEAGLYVDPSDPATVVGSRVTVDKEVSSGVFEGQIEVAAQAQVMRAFLAMEDSAGNRTDGTEFVVLGTDDADVLGDETATSVQLLYGFEGDDTLSSGTERDILYGGAGSDRFVFAEDSGNCTDKVNVIIDFTTGSDSLAAGYADNTNPGDYKEDDGSAFADLAALVNDAETNHLGDGTHYVFYYNTALAENSTDKVSGYLLIDRGDSPDGTVDQVIELIGMATAADFDATDIVV